MNFFKYVIPTEEDKDWGIVINTAGHLIRPKDSENSSGDHPVKYALRENRGRVLDEFQVIYIIKGRGEYIDEKNKKYPVIPGTIITVIPGKQHFYGPSKDTGWESYYIGFSGNFPIQLLKKGFFKSISPVLQLGLDEEIFDLFSKMLELVKKEEYGSMQIVSGYLIRLLALLRKKAAEEKTTFYNHASQISQAKIIYMQNIEEDADHNKIAGQVGMGYASFRKFFKKYTGLSPNNYFLTLKIEKAKDLLISSDYPIKDIAYRLNFTSENYFVRLFKTKTGHTPGKYRDSNFFKNQ